MARYVDVVAVEFRTRAEPGEPGAKDIVLRETAAALQSLAGTSPDLVVLCESIEGTAQSLDDAEELTTPGAFLRLYAEFATAENCVVAGSVKLRENGKAYNSIAYLGPDGQALGAYHKTHLIREELAEGLTPGSGPVVVDTPVGRLGGVICFDLNFEEHRHAYRERRPEILTFASMYHGGFVQQMWAYDCRAFFVSALPMAGSGILNPLGQPLALTDEYNRVARARINLDHVLVHLDYNQEKFPAIRRAYGDAVRIDIPAHVGSAILSSCTADRTAREIAQEYELELLDDYLGRT